MIDSSTSATGIIIVDHGSRFSAANEMLLEVVAVFKRVSGCTIVEPAHMEIAEPSIARAFAACVRQGAKSVIVHPYFLAPGRHSTTDIPRLVAEAAQDHPSIAHHVTQPLGVHEAIARLILQRINDCVDQQYECASCATRGCAPGVDASFTHS